MKRIAVLLASAMLAVVPAAAQTLDECHRLACLHYPEIRQYDLIRQSAQYDLSNAAKAWLPQLSFSAQATWQNNVPELPASLSGILSQSGATWNGLERDQYKIALELSQTLWDGGTTRAERRMTESESAEQEIATTVDLYAIEGRVNDLYFGILLLDERLQQTGLTMDLLKSNLEKMRAMVANGVAMQTDADAVEAELLSVGQQLAEIEASRKSYRQMLELFIGQPLADTLERPQATEPDIQVSGRPELELFDARQNILTARENAIKAATRPRFSLFAQGYYGYPGFDYFAGMLSSEWSWNVMIGVRMSWNFGALYTKKNNLSKIRTARQQIDLQRDIFMFNTDLQETQERNDIARLRRALSDDDRIVALRRSVREAAESKLRNGIIDTNDLLGKITDEATARSARSVREIELLKTIYELKHTINR